MSGGLQEEAAGPPRELLPCCLEAWWSLECWGGGADALLASAEVKPGVVGLVGE